MIKHVLAAALTLSPLVSHGGTDDLLLDVMCTIQMGNLESPKQTNITIIDNHINIADLGINKLPINHIEYVKNGTILTFNNNQAKGNYLYSYFYNFNENIGYLDKALVSANDPEYLIYTMHYQFNCN